MKRYEIQEGADGFIIKDLLTDQNVNDGFDDVFPTQQEAQEYMDKEGLSEEEFPYEILRRKHDLEGQTYFYIWDNNLDRAVQDEDGDVYHMDSYDEAMNFVIELVSSANYAPKIKATAEVKEPLFAVYNTETGIFAKRFSGNGKVLNLHSDKKAAKHVADMLNANSHSQNWVVAHINKVELV